MTPLTWFLFLIPFALATCSAVHALLHKRDPRAALGWIAVCITFPVAGPLLYFIFGINRVRRSAMRLREHTDIQREHAKALQLHGVSPAAHYADSVLDTPHIPPRYRNLERVGSLLPGMPLTGGNCIEPLHNGEQTYPRMLHAIRHAKQSVLLCTYIMDTGPIGRQFVKALQDAVKRGVDVRVLIDGVGEKYSWPYASRLLRKADIPVAKFLPPKWLLPRFTVNLRNHRKILVVDGFIAFTGGMNIGKRHMMGGTSSRRISDIHFLLHGPLASQLQEAFISDWEFATGQFVPPPRPEQEWAGDTLGRVILNGPDEYPDRLPLLLNGVISSAEHSIRIMTPYFLPSRELVSTLKAAALRGVNITVILPAKNNLPFVHWATRNQLTELLEHHIRVLYQPAPFCHSKLLIIDGCYVHLGSANLDPRSLHLNYELTVEVFDLGLARNLTRHFDTLLKKSQEVFASDMQKRPFLVRIRDAFFWLFSPYL